MAQNQDIVMYYYMYVPKLRIHVADIHVVIHVYYVPKLYIAANNMLLSANNTLY